MNSFTSSVPLEYQASLMYSPQIQQGETGKPGGNRGQRPFFLTREDLYGNIYLLWQEWQELSY